MMAVEKILQRLASLVALTGVAPAFLYLDRQAQLGIVLALVAGFICDRRKHRLLRPLPATLLSLLWVAFYLAQMSFSHIVEPLVNLLVLLLAVRLVTEKSGRNLLQIFVLATFILAASSLLSLSLGYLAGLIIFVTLVTYGLLLTSFYATDPGLCLGRHDWLSLLRTGALLPLGALVLMLLFFVILPRTQYPLWNFLNPGPKASTGLSELVNPGNLTDLGASGAPAFRAEMAEIDPQDLYWRGLVLNRLDGDGWHREPRFPPDQLVRQEAVARTQIIYTEARSARYLPGLDLPARVGGIRNNPSDDAVFRAARRIATPLRYSVDSFPRSSLQIRNPSESRFYLETPPQIAPRVSALAAQIAQGEDRRTKIEATRDFFIQQQLSYATRNLPLSTSPVETFLFESRRGYCEYFASSFALLLRLAGVPARLVGGYLGGRYNALGGYYLIDEDMAHVWVEALDDNQHWQRIDPSRLARNAAQAVAGLARHDFAWSQAAADYLDTAWTRLVITYDLQKQLGLLFSAGAGLRRLQPPHALILFGWLAVVLLPPALLLLSRRLKHPPANQQRLLKSYLRRVCQAAGLKRLPPHLGLFRLAELSKEPLCRDFARIYGQAAYRERPLSRQQIAQLHEIIRQLATRRIHFEIPLDPPWSMSPSDRGND